MRILIFLVGAVLVCASGGLMWKWARGVDMALLLGIIAATWILFLFSGVEKGIRSYVKNPNTMIGCRYTMILESHRITVRVPERKVNINLKVNELVAVFELSRAFMIYTSVQDAYILPFRALTREQLDEVKENFRHHLGDQFSENKGLRFGKRK